MLRMRIQRGKTETIVPLVFSFHFRREGWNGPALVGHGGAIGSREAPVTCACTKADRNRLCDL